MLPRQRKSKTIVDGLLLLDKPSGMSSNRALQTAKHLFDARKAGHTGSLDPLATGLLPLCFGQATKISGIYLNSNKRYEVIIRLGVSTDSGDSEGDVIGQSNATITRNQIDDVLSKFIGQIFQVPPMYSALKRNGQPLYKLARQGVGVSREPREVTVYELMVNEFKNNLLNISVSCSKGFYIRSLAMDIGTELGCGGHVTRLRRTGVGKFSIEQAITLDQLKFLKTPESRQKLLIPTDQALTHLPKIDLSKNSAQYFCQGQTVRAVTQSVLGLARLYSDDETFLGLGEVISDGSIAPKRLFV